LLFQLCRNLVGYLDGRWASLIGGAGLWAGVGVVSGWRGISAYGSDDHGTTGGIGAGESSVLHRLDI
jgi:hypothetical protein